MDEGYKDNQIKQPDDTNTPFSEPDDVPKGLGDTQQQTDTNMDPDEEYHHGTGEAAAAFDPEKADPTEDDEQTLMADTY